MRRERSPGGFVNVSANIGTEGRYRTGVFGNYTQGRYSLQGNLARSKGKNDSSGELRRERIDPVTGAIARSTSFSNGVNEDENTSANGGLTYNWGDKDVIRRDLMEDLFEPRGVVWNAALRHGA